MSMGPCRFWAIVVFLALPFFFACSGGDDDPLIVPDGDTDLPEDESSLIECTDNAQCNAGFFCTPGGQCVSRCERHSDCASHICDRESGECLMCLIDNDCAQYSSGYECTLTCRDGACVCPDPDGDREIEEEEESDAEDQPVIAKCLAPGDGRACEPGCSECTNSMTSRICREDGGGFTSANCTSKQYCNRYTGLCTTTMCDPFEVGCDGNTALLCREDGSGWERTECSASSVCAEGACINNACESIEIVHLFTFDVHSRVGAPDQRCIESLNLGSAEWHTITDRGEVAEFNGVDSRMTLPGSAVNFLQAMTVMADVYLDPRPNADTLSETIVGKGDPSSFELAVENGKAVFRITTGTGEKKIEGVLALPRGRWWHLAGTFDGLSMALFVNGEQQGPASTFPTRQTIRAASSRPVSVGARTRSTDEIERPFKGFIDNLYFSAMALAANEIAYFQENPRPCPVAAGEETELYCRNLCDRRTFPVSAAKLWVNSSLQLRTAEAVMAYPGGCLPHPTQEQCVTISGLSDNLCMGEGCPLVNGRRYSLIARLAADQAPFELDSERVVVAPDRPGHLEFAVNNDDLLDGGGYSVTIERGYCRGSWCPSGMVSIPGFDACIDRYEASCPEATHADASACSSDSAVVSEPAKSPWIGITPSEAQDACRRVGKRLCTEEEWGDSCGTNYPYGNEHVVRTCNDNSVQPPNPYSELLPTGYMYGCVSDNGVFDLSGNAGEFCQVSTTSGFKSMAGKRATEDSSCDDYLPVLASDSGPRYGFRCCITVDP